MAAATADTGGAFLPVLAGREESVQAAFTDRWPTLESNVVRTGGYDSLGYLNGRMAADRAQLSFADITGQAEPTVRGVRAISAS